MLRRSLRDNRLSGVTTTLDCLLECQCKALTRPLVVHHAFVRFFIQTFGISAHRLRVDY